MELKCSEFIKIPLSASIKEWIKPVRTMVALVSSRTPHALCVSEGHFDHILLSGHSLVLSIQREVPQM